MKWSREKSRLIRRTHPLLRNHQQVFSDLPLALVHVSPGDLWAPKAIHSQVLLLAAFLLEKFYANLSPVHTPVLAPVARIAG
jgi:hypothetical protein